VSGIDHPGIWAAMGAWAGHYHAEIAARATITQSDNIHAYVEFRYHGLRVQITTVVSPDDDPDQDD
jgi:hypothetical protein